MNEFFEANKRALLLLGTMLFILTLVLYFILLRPLQADYKSEQAAMEQLNFEIELLETRLEQFDGHVSEIDLEQLVLENKIPKKRELDEYILTLQQLELRTESKIESINFSYDSSLAIDTSDPVEEEADVTRDLEAEIDAKLQVSEDDTNNDREASEEENAAELEPTVDPEILKEKPEQLHVLSVRLDVKSQNFDDFIEFLKLIERNERISIVTNLSFTRPTEQELQFTEDPSREVPFQAEITTFYYED